MHVKKRNSSTNFYQNDERMAKKPNDRLGIVIQNSPKTATSEHSKCQKFMAKDSQKTTVFSWKAHAHPHLSKNLFFLSYFPKSNKIA